MIVNAGVAGVAVGTIILQTMSIRIIVVVVVVGCQGFSGKTILRAVVVVPKVAAVVGSLLSDCLLDPAIRNPHMRRHRDIWNTRIPSLITPGPPARPSLWRSP